jgi:hypothetical protein
VHFNATSQILVTWAKQALTWNILCGIGVRFNSICDEMLGGVARGCRNSAEGVAAKNIFQFPKLAANGSA